MKKPADAERSKVKPITAKRLENYALFYLGRYASSAENVRQILFRKIRRAPEKPDESVCAAWIDEIVRKFQDNGILDDAVYADGQANSLHRRGISRAGIRQRLAAKGVPREIIDHALENFRDEHAERAAAGKYAKRRRLGPYRLKDRTAYRDKDLAALGRQGYSYEIARMIIDAEDLPEC